MCQKFYRERWGNPLPIANMNYAYPRVRHNGQPTFLAALPQPNINLLIYGRPGHSDEATINFNENLINASDRGTFLVGIVSWAH